MKHIYTITGMTCNNCVASVTSALSSVDAIQDLSLDLKKGEALISMSSPISLEELNSVLSDKYSINEKANINSELSKGIEEKNLSCSN